MFEVSRLTGPCTSNQLFPPSVDIWSVACTFLTRETGQSGDRIWVGKRERVFLIPRGVAAALRQEALAGHEAAELDVYRPAAACFGACIARLWIDRSRRRERVMPGEMPVPLIWVMSVDYVHRLVIGVARQRPPAKECALHGLRRIQERI